MPYTVQNIIRRLPSYKMCGVTLLLALLALMTVSCRDELDLPGGYCPEGEAATVTVAIDTGEMTELTRGDMAAGLDRRVVDLWVAVYNVATGARTGVVKISPDQTNTEHSLREVKLDALSGYSYIVGVANYSHRYGATSDDGELLPLETILDGADTWDKYCALSAAFDPSGGVSMDTPLNALVMTGSFKSGEHAGGNRYEDEPVAVQPGLSKPAGALHLRRLISQVRFNVTYDKTTVQEFKVKSWKVVNLPNQAWLHDRADDAAATNAPDVRRNVGKPYSASGEMHEISSTDNTYTFDFWQLENKRRGRVPDALPDNIYKYRERQYKNEAGMNTGKFSALVDSKDSEDPNNNATYVVFDVEMFMKVDENGKPLSSTAIRLRRVETKYYVHLGYIEGGADRLLDFNCRRNSRYTYNVTIKNVNDVLVEARNENGEQNPAVEGIVTDVTKTHFDVDAHYAVMNVQLTRDELNDFHYMVIAYDLDGKEVTIDSHDAASLTPALKRYMEWVEFRKTTGESVIQAYKPRSGTYSDGKTFTLQDMRDKGKNLEEGWYTMFINEYVYEDVENGNESGSTNWHGYVNRPDRSVWINVQAKVSNDGQSLHYVSKYAVSQKSIQTYYTMSSKSGLGVEHVNESYGLNLCNSYNPNGNGNVNSGRYNLAYYLAGNSSWSTKDFSWTDNRYRWSSFMNLNSLQNVNKISAQGVNRDARTEFLPKIQASGSKSGYDPDQSSNPNNIQAITACLNRNRDLDGDGYIDASELRWFVPVRSQYVRIILGRRSLVNPILDIESTDRLTYSDNTLNSSMLFYTSDGRKIYAMEGTSDAAWNAYAASSTWEVRCVRNLGGDMSVINVSNITEPAFSRRPGTNIIDLTHYDAKSIRTEPYYSSDNPMPVHQIYDQRFNRCYSAFEFASGYDISGSDMKDLSVNSYDWADYLSTHNPCKDLVAKTGKDGWRVPNQKELTIMAILGVIPTNYTYVYSCSVSYYDKERYALGANPKDPVGQLGVASRYVMKATSTGMVTQGGDGTTNFGVRCVRDYLE